MALNNAANHSGLIPNVVLRSALKTKNSLNIIHINIRSLLNKIALLKSFIIKTNTHIILLSETWLNCDISSEMVKLPGFKLFRNDRSKLDESGNIKTGGGVAIYVKCGLPVKVLSHSNHNDDIEFIIAETKINNETILLGSVYFSKPAAYKLTPFMKELDKFSSKFNNIIIGGDFNIDIIDCSNILKNIFEKKIKNFALDIVNTSIPTRYSKTRNSLLDIFITSAEFSNRLHFGQVSIPGTSDHDLIYLSVNINTSFRKE